MDRLEEPNERSVEGLLRPAQLAPSPRLRQTVLDQTLEAIRQRRRVLRICRWTAMAACYAAGVATALLLRGTSSNPEPAQRIASADRSLIQSAPDLTSADQEMAQDSSAVTPAEPADSDLPPPVLERIANFVGHDQFRDLNRKAGDRYLSESSDLVSALRCYRRVLDSSSLEELAISDDDNWLMITLKQARLKELRYVNHGG